MADSWRHAQLLRLLVWLRAHSTLFTARCGVCGGHYAVQVPCAPRARRGGVARCGRLLTGAGAQSQAEGLLPPTDYAYTPFLRGAGADAVAVAALGRAAAGPPRHAMCAGPRAPA